MIHHNLYNNSFIIPPLPSLISEEEIRKQISWDITKIHLKNQFTMKYSERTSRKVLNKFYQAFYISPNMLEKIKTTISSEEHDLKDLTDLLEDLHPVVRRELTMLFMTNYSLSNKYLYHTQVITDLDCTLFENANIAQPVYGGNRFTVAGIFPLLKSLTRNGSTCLTVITARPSSIEAHSLISNRERLTNVGIGRYSFQSGELDGTIHFLMNKCFRKLGMYKEANDELKRASLLFAALKYKCYLRLKEAYPYSQFVFTGDDAQGDYIFATLLVQDNPKNFAFIRNATSQDLAVTPYTHHWPSNSEIEKAFQRKNFIPNLTNNFNWSLPNFSERILYVSNFYEAIAKAPFDVLEDSLKQNAILGSLEEFNQMKIKEYRTSEIFWLNLFKEKTQQQADANLHTKI